MTGENGYDEIFKTDKNGEILIEGLRIGKYIISEVNNDISAGYLLPDDKVVEIKYGKTAKAEMHNEKIHTPKTGDESNPNLWLILGGASAVGVAACATALIRKRKKNGKEAEE